MKKNKKGIKKRNSSKLPQSSVNIDSEGEKLRGIAENKSMEIRQVELDEVCDVCGHIGFDIALMYCSMCSDTAVHQYCLGIPPGSIDDTYHWLCEYCSPSMESGHQKSSFEESLKDPRLSFELETEQDENMILMVEEDVEPLCILPPLVHRENCEHQCRNTYSTSNSHLLNSKEKHDPYSGNGSLHQIGEDISWNGPISLYQPFNDSLDRVESEASVSSLMECPKEIISGLVLLVSLSGDIVIQGDLSFCSCPAPSIGNMANSCNGMNSKKSANDLSFKMKPHLASYVDEPVGMFGEVAYECVNQEIVELAGCSHGTDHDVDAVHAVDTCQKNGGEDADSCGIKRKRESTQVNFDLLQPLGPQCKRIRSKRYKISSSWNKEAGAPLAVDIPSIGKEGSSKVVMLRNTCHGIGQAETSVNIDSLTRDGLQVEGIYKNCGLYSGMVDTCCGNNAKERCAQVDDGLCDQGDCTILSKKLKREEFEDKVVWISGASRGIGEALAKHFVSLGAKLILSARNEAELERVRSQLIGKHAPGDVKILPLDLTSGEDSLREAVQRAEAFFPGSGVDYMIHNAAYERPKSSALDVSEESLKATFNVNVLGPITLTTLLAPYMVKRGRGHFIVMSSTAGKIASPSKAVYSASKFSLHGYFHCLRSELFQKGIKVTVVCPGPTETSKDAQVESSGQGKRSKLQRSVSGERCSQLIAIAASNGLKEVWICYHPALAMMYLTQYMPTFSFWLMDKIGGKRVEEAAQEKPKKT